MESLGGLVILKPFYSDEEKRFESESTLPAVINVDLKFQNVIVLGRNAETGLIEKPGKHVHFVSRSHAELLIKDRKIFLKPSSKMRSIVHLNGSACAEEETELKIGDKICLLGAQKFFNFEVCKEPVKETAVAENVLRHYECSICYETMAYAHSLSCGDSFCYSCISDWASQQKSSCPLCQAAFLLPQAILNKTVNSAIREMLMSGGVEERAQEWERRYEEGLQQKKLKAAATSSSSSSSSLSSSSSAAAQTSSNTSSVPMQQVSWGAIGGPLPLPLPGRDSGTDRAAESWRSYSSRRTTAHDPDLHAPGAKRMRRLERLAGRFMPLMMDPGKSHSRPAAIFAAAAVPASSSLGALGDGTSRSVHSHRHDTAVVDLTSSFVEDLPDDLAFLSDAFPSDTPTQNHSHSHSRRSQGTGSGRAIPAADCCYLAVYVSEIPAFRTLSVPLNCDHCKQSLRAAPSPPSASSSSSSSSLSGRSSSDVVIGIVSAAPAPSSVVRSQQAWLALCGRWVHPTCLRGVNRDRVLRGEEPVCYGNLKYTELLSFAARQDLARMMLTA